MVLFLSARKKNRNVGCRCVISTKCQLYRTIHTWEEVWNTIFKIAAMTAILNFGSTLSAVGRDHVPIFETKFQKYRSNRIWV